MQRILFLLSESDWTTFFPGRQAELVRSLADESRFIDPSATNETAWRAALQSFQPTILVAGWKSPALPDDVLELTGHHLKYVCFLAGSVRSLVTKKHLEQGLLLTNWGNSVSRVVAECGLMLAIAALRRVGHWQVAMHSQGSWKTPQTVTGSLFERTVGIHGFGAIAQELVRLLKPFAVAISAFDPWAPAHCFEALSVQRADSLEALFSNNEVIFELAPLTPETKGLVTEAHLRSIPEGGAFINIGRGAVVDEAALGRVAAEGKIQLALDVYGTEPLPVDSPLRGSPNVVLLPHLGGPTTDRRQDAGRFAIENIRAYLAGQALQAVVTEEIYDRAT